MQETPGKMNINLIKKIWFGPKYDGVIEAVRYNSKGGIRQVRAYQRRGPTFSDHVLLDRDMLLQELNDGKRYYTGERKENLGSEFELGQLVKLSGKNGSPKIITENLKQSKKDKLVGVPQF